MSARRGTGSGRRIVAVSRAPVPYRPRGGLQTAVAAGVVVLAVIGALTVLGWIIGALAWLIRVAVLVLLIAAAVAAVRWAARGR